MLLRDSDDVIMIFWIEYVVKYDFYRTLKDTLKGCKVRAFYTSSIFHVPSALLGRPQSCSGTIWRQVLQIENLWLHLRLLRPWNASPRRALGGATYVRKQRWNDDVRVWCWHRIRGEFFVGRSIDFINERNNRRLGHQEYSSNLIISLWITFVPCNFLGIDTYCYFWYDKHKN